MGSDRTGGGVMSDEEQDPGEGLKVNWSSDEFSLKGKVQVPPKFWYLLRGD